MIKSETSPLIRAHNRRVQQFLGNNFDVREAIIHEERSAKFRAYINSVIFPAGSALQSIDQEAHVMVSGSYAYTNGKNLRAGSDCDFFIISPQLKIVESYLDYLLKINSFHHYFMEDTGIIPVTFTQVSREEDSRRLSLDYFMNNKAISRRGSQVAEQFLPVHFLYYPSFAIFLGREPDALARQLLRVSNDIVGSIDKQAILKLPPISNELDSARWNLERSMAELIINIDFLPFDHLIRRYKQIVLNTVRGPIGDVLFRGEEIAGNTGQILARLEADFDFCQSNGGVNQVFKVLQQIHENDQIPRNLDLKTIIQPSILLIKLVDSLREKYN